MSTMAASTREPCKACGGHHATMRDYEAKKFLNLSKPEQAAYIRGVCHTLVGIIIAALLVVFAGTRAHAEEHCQTMPGEIYCWDTDKGGAPMDHIEKNQFGGIDIRHQDGSITRCTKRAGTPAMWDCREIK